MAKILFTLREHLSSGDKQHPLRKHITIEKMEEYTRFLDTLFGKTVH